MINYHYFCSINNWFIYIFLFSCYFHRIHLIGNIIGVFNYDGRYELDNVAVAIASRFKAFISQINNDNQTTVPKKGAEAKTKEEKLKELKDLFEKQLINKEDYDRQKQKILDE